MTNQNKYYKFYETKTRNTNKGLFNFLQTNLSLKPKITSSEPLSNIYAMLNLSSNEYTCSESIKKLPFTIDISFPKYSFMIFDYLLQGRKSYRAMRIWSLLGKNSLYDEWEQIDYRDNYDYCTIEENDYCSKETETFLPCINTTKPYRYLQFKLIHDTYSYDNRGEAFLRIKNFEIYGSLLLIQESLVKTEYFHLKSGLLIALL